jgi:YD repeat-containing protein
MTPVFDGRLTPPQYDSRGFLTQSINALSHTATMLYDPHGNRTAVRGC